MIPATQQNNEPEKKTESLNVVRVVVADDRATFRNTLRTILEAETDLTIVGEASDAKTVLAMARNLDPDVVLIDVVLFYSLNGHGGTQPAFRTLVTVPTLDPADIIKAFLHGARAVVPKSSPSHVWRESIHAVGAVQYWLVNESIPVLVKALQDHFPHETESKSRNDCKLTPRELEITDFLKQHADLNELVRKDLERGLKNPDSGRRGITSEQTLRSMILMRVKNLDYRDLRDRVQRWLHVALLYAVRQSLRAQARCFQPCLQPAHPGHADGGSGKGAILAGRKGPAVGYAMELCDDSPGLGC